VISKGFSHGNTQSIFEREIKETHNHMSPIDIFDCSQDLSVGNTLSLFKTKKETLIMFQKDKFEKNKKIIYGKLTRNTKCVSQIFLSVKPFVFLWETPFGNHKTYLEMGFSRGNSTWWQQC